MESEGGKFNIKKLFQSSNANGGSTDTLGASVPNLHDATSTTNIYQGGHLAGGRKVSLVQLTMEAFPREYNYRNLTPDIRRPSLGAVHGEANDGKKSEDAGEAEEEHAGHVKLGWIQGVFIQCTLNIWGVMLFLRLSWVVGQSGILESLIIIAISTIVCVITTLSLSAICTNGEIKGGGIYYIISRSLGPEFGAAIGIVFAFANAVAASMNTIGFCASLNDLLKSEGYKIIDNGNNDTRIVGVVAIFLMCVISIVGMDWEVIANDVMFVVIGGAILDFLIGAAIGPRSDIDRARGFTGFSPEIFAQNFYADYRYTEGQQQSIITVFAIFFPSVTGIQAGANISGDLKDAGGSIPKGTLLAILLTMISYVVFVLFAGGAGIRDASGILEEYYNGTHTNCSGRVDPCIYGLENSYSVMQQMSVWGYFIYAGCFAATLSTALTNVLSVPKILQALGRDHIYPGFEFFSKGYFKSGEPVRGYVLTYFVSCAFLLIADLNAIAPLISNFYLASYGMMNFCAFHAAHVKPLGWRPSFKYYNKWLSLFGCIVCVVIMFIIDWITSLITFIIIFALYMIVVYRKPDVNWGSSTQAMTYKTALQSAHHLNNILDHAKTYRPQILVLSGKPQHRPPLMDLAYLITKHKALLVCGEISQFPLTNRERETRSKLCQEYFIENKIKSFYSLIDGMGFEEGAKALMQTSGIGKLKPNILMMGFKTDWQTCSTFDLNSYFHVLHDAFDCRMAVTIVRLPEGVNFSKIAEEQEANGLANSTNFLSTIDIRAGSGLPFDSNLNINSAVSNNPMGGVGLFLPPDSPEQKRNYNFDENTMRLGVPKDTMNYKKTDNPEIEIKKECPVIPAEVKLSMTYFKRKHKKALIDVWWLYDDGGLTILLPHIISLRKNWEGAKLRIFALTNHENELELEERNMAQLLAKFRIDYKCLTMVTGITNEPKERTVKDFNRILDEFRVGDGGTNNESIVTDDELENLKAKTDRQLRLKEMLQTHSKQSELIFMSLPMPRKGEVSAPLYMAWLEMLTIDMPPIVLVRGNHSSVLTFLA